MVVVRPSGRASWVLENRNQPGDTKKPHPLGKYPDLTLSKACENAVKARQEIAAGEYPTVKRANAKIAETQEKARVSDSVRLLMEDWLKNAEITSIYEGNIRAAFIKDVLPEIGSSIPADVTTRRSLHVRRMTGSALKAATR